MFCYTLQRKNRKMKFSKNKSNFMHDQVKGSTAFLIPNYFELNILSSDFLNLGFLFHDTFPWSIVYVLLARF